MRARDAQLWCHRILFISIYVSSLQRKEINKTKWGHNTFGFSIFSAFPFFLFAFRLSVFQLRFFMNFNERSPSSSVVSFAIFCLVCYAKCILQQTSRKSSMALSLSTSASRIFHLNLAYFKLIFPYAVCALFYFVQRATNLVANAAKIVANLSDVLPTGPTLLALRIVR